jgi:hypothetical protein
MMKRWIAKTIISKHRVLGRGLTLYFHLLYLPFPSPIISELQYILNCLIVLYYTIG